MRRKESKKEGKGKMRSHEVHEVFMSISPVRLFSPQFAQRIAPHATGINVGSVNDRQTRPDPQV